MPGVRQGPVKSQPEKSDQAVIVYTVEGVSGRDNSECKVNHSVYAVGRKYGKSDLPLKIDI